MPLFGRALGPRPLRRPARPRGRTSSIKVYRRRLRWPASPTGEEHHHEDALRDAADLVGDRVQHEEQEPEHRHDVHPTVSPRGNGKHNVWRAILRTEAKGWAIESGGGPSRSRSMTSRCATPRHTNSRRLANRWGSRSAATRCGGSRRPFKNSEATRPRGGLRGPGKP